MSAPTVIHTAVDSWDKDNVYAYETPANGRTRYTMPATEVGGEAAKVKDYRIDIEMHWVTLSDGTRKCSEMVYKVPVASK